MKIFHLIRIAFTESGTFGVFLDEGIPFCVTLERPWKNNQRNISCIPGGQYTCERVQSEKFGNTFEVKNVPGRSLIRFHSGNIDDDSHGCILLGEMFEPMFGEKAIKNPIPGKAMREFLERTKDIDSFILRIGIPRGGLNA